MFVLSIGLMDSMNLVNGNVQSLVRIFKSRIGDNLQDPKIQLVRILTISAIVLTANNVGI